MTEEQLLVLLCKKGEAKAQKLLYEQFANKMFRLCFRYVKDEMEAEDSMISGFVKVFAHIGNFEYRTEKSLESWIKRIMVNESLMQLRKRNNFTMISETHAREIETDQGIAEMSMNAEEIYALILQLPVGYRTVFNLYAIEGYSHKEIGEQLQISENTSKSQLSKARAMLRKMLKKTGITYEA